MRGWGCWDRGEGDGVMESVGGEGCGRVVGGRVNRYLTISERFCRVFFTEMREKGDNTTIRFRHSTPF